MRAHEILRRIAIVHAILAMAVFVFPGGLVDWLDQRNVDGRLAAPLALAHAIDTVSGAIGAKRAGESLRARFAAIIGDGDG